LLSFVSLCLLALTLSHMMILAPYTSLLPIQTSAHREDVTHTIENELLPNSSFHLPTSTSFLPFSFSLRTIMSELDVKPKLEPHEGDGKSNSAVKPDLSDSNGEKAVKLPKPEQHGDDERSTYPPPPPDVKPDPTNSTSKVTEQEKKHRQPSSASTVSNQSAASGFSQSSATSAPSSSVDLNHHAGRPASLYKVRLAAEGEGCMRSSVFLPVLNVPSFRVLY
jgi:hypothetical protein